MGLAVLWRSRLCLAVPKPLLKVGDRIIYKNVGAYTMCLTPMFIRYIPNVYVLENGDYKLVREKWTANEYIKKSTIK